MSKQNKAKLFSFKYFLMDLIRVSGALPGLIWLRPKIRYTSKAAKKRIRGGALLVSNHTSFVDPALVMFAVWYRRQKFVCHQAFMETKAGPFFRAAGCCIPIDADNFNIGSFREITESLRDGNVVTMFPEGHVNQDDGKVKEFKTGTALISMQSKCPVVPVYIKPRLHWYSRLKVVIDEPVADMCGDRPAFSQINEITKHLQQREEFLEEYAEKI